MGEIILSHCFSCGQDCSASPAVQKTGSPILRCGKCHSLNFRVMERKTVTDEENNLDFPHLQVAVEQNYQESEEECATS